MDMDDSVTQQRYSWSVSLSAAHHGVRVQYTVHNATSTTPFPFVRPFAHMRRSVERTSNTGGSKGGKLSNSF